MMHKAWSSIEEVPYCFARSYVKLQGHTAKKNRRFWPKLGVSGLQLQLEFTDGYEMMHRAWGSIVEVPYCFSRSYIKLQGHTALKIVEFDPNWGVSGLLLQFEFTNGYEMLHKAWNSIGEMPYCFPRSSIKFQGHTVQNITDFDPNWAFPDYRPVAAFKSLRFALLTHHVLHNIPLYVDIEMAQVIEILTHGSQERHGCWWPGNIRSLRHWQPWFWPVQDQIY